MPDFRSFAALGETDESPSRERIEAYTRIRLPARADELLTRLDQVLTKRTTFVRFALDPEDLAPFLRDSGFDERLSSTVLPDLLRRENRPRWFVPERARSYLAGETSGRALLIDTTEPSRAVVYVVARS